MGWLSDLFGSSSDNTAEDRATRSRVRIEIEEHRKEADRIHRQEERAHRAEEARATRNYERQRAEKDAAENANQRAWDNAKY